MHDVYTIGIPVLVILIANFINRADLKDFRAEMNAKFDKMQAQMDRRFDDVDKRFNAIDAELRYFHGVTGKLDGRIEAIEKRKYLVAALSALRKAGRVPRPFLRVS